MRADELKRKLVAVNEIISVCKQREGISPIVWGPKVGWVLIVCVIGLLTIRLHGFEIIFAFAAIGTWVYGKKLGIKSWDEILVDSITEYDPEDKEAYKDLLERIRLKGMVFGDICQWSGYEKSKINELMKEINPSEIDQKIIERVGRLG